MTTVLFACVHNAGRSQMAAALFNELADPSEARAISAGTNPGPRVHPEVIEAMRELGADLSSAKTTKLTTDLAQQARVLVTMGCGDECPFVPASSGTTGRSRRENHSRRSEPSRRHPPAYRDVNQSERLGPLSMTPLTIFGVLAVTAMLVFYTLEEQSPAFVLLFASACAASSVYGFLQGAWPFGVVEAVWTSVAIRRWRMRVHVDAPTERRPIACDMSALTSDDRRRYDELRSRITASVKEVVSTSTSFRLQLDQSVSLPEIAEWVGLEHRCCPFLNIALTVQPDDTRWVELGDSAAIKEFLQEEFAQILH